MPEPGLTVGLATPHIVASAVTLISRWVRRIANVIQKLVRSINNLRPLLRRLDEIWETLRTGFRRAPGGSDSPTSGVPSATSAPDPVFGPATHPGTFLSRGLPPPGRGRRVGVGPAPAGARRRVTTARSWTAYQTDHELVQRGRHRPRLSTPQAAHKWGQPCGLLGRFVYRMEQSGAIHRGSRPTPDTHSGHPQASNVPTCSDRPHPQCPQRLLLRLYLLPTRQRSETGMLVTAPNRGSACLAGGDALP